MVQIAVDVDLFHALDTFKQPVAQHADTLVFDLHFQTRKPERFPHADNLVGRKRSRTKTTLMTTTVHLRFQANPRFATYEQRAHALGAVSLVSRKAHEVYFQRLQIDQHFTGGLCRIDMKNNSFFPANLTNLCNRLNHANFVVHKHHRHQNRIRTQCRFEYRHVDQAVVLYLEIGRVESLPLELANGVKRGFVFGFHRDNVFAFGLVEIGRTFQSEIDRFGCA